MQHGTYYVSVTSLISTRHCITLWLDDPEKDEPVYVKTGGIRYTRGEAITKAHEWAEELGVEYR